jgi:hypothetical protein
MTTSERATDATGSVWPVVSAAAAGAASHRNPAIEIHAAVNGIL